jgi:hypothetical protein
MAEAKTVVSTTTPPLEEEGPSATGFSHGSRSSSAFEDVTPIGDDYAQEADNIRTEGTNRSHQQLLYDGLKSIIPVSGGLCL